MSLPPTSYELYSAIPGSARSRCACGRHADRAAVQGFSLVFACYDCAAGTHAVWFGDTDGPAPKALLEVSCDVGGVGARAEIAVGPALVITADETICVPWGVPPAGLPADVRSAVLAMDPVSSAIRRRVTRPEARYQAEMRVEDAVLLRTRAEGPGVSRGGRWARISADFESARWSDALVDALQAGAERIGGRVDGAGLQVRPVSRYGGDAGRHWGDHVDALIRVTAIALLSQRAAPEPAPAPELRVRGGVIPL